MNLAGPVEFSTFDIVVMLVVVAAFYLAPPAIGALIGVAIYRARTPESDRSRSKALRAAGFGALAGIGVSFVIGAIATMISGLGF